MVRARYKNVVLKMDAMRNVEQVSNSIKTKVNNLTYVSCTHDPKQMHKQRIHLEDVKKRVDFFFLNSNSSIRVSTSAAFYWKKCLYCWRTKMVRFLVVWAQWSVSMALIRFWNVSCFIESLSTYNNAKVESPIPGAYEHFNGIAFFLGKPFHWKIGGLFPIDSGVLCLIYRNMSVF